MSKEEDRIERIRQRLAREERNGGRTELDTDTSIRAMKEYNDRKFKEYQTYGKIAESKVMEILLGRGFQVTDISLTAYGDSLSPFDLDVMSPSGENYLVDVKHQTPIKGRYMVFNHQKLKWISYSTLATKLIVFYTNQTWTQEWMRGMESVTRFINVGDIGERTYIPVEDTKDIQCLL